MAKRKKAKDYSHQLNAISEFSNLTKDKKWQRVDPSPVIYHKHFDSAVDELEGMLFVLPGLMVEKYNRYELRPIRNFRPYLFSHNKFTAKFPGKHSECYNVDEILFHKKFEVLEVLN